MSKKAKPEIATALEAEIETKYPQLFGCVQTRDYDRRICILVTDPTTKGPPLEFEYEVSKYSPSLVFEQIEDWLATT